MADIPSFDDFVKSQAPASPVPAAKGDAVPSFDDFVKTPAAEQPPTNTGLPKTDASIVVPGATTTIPEFLRPSQPGEMTLPEAVEQGYRTLGPNLVHMWDSIKQINNMSMADFKKLRDEKSPLRNPEGFLMGPVELAKSLWNKYGSWGKIKETIAHQPEQVLGDMLALIPGGAVEEGTAKSLGTLGKLPALASEGIHGTGPGALAEIYRAGRDATPEVWNILKRGMDTDQAVKELNDAFDQLGHMRAHAYDAKMSQIEQSTTPLNFKDIDKAVDDANEIRTFTPKNQMGPFDAQHGPVTAQVERNPGIQNMKQSVQDLIEEWRRLGPQFHTAFGLDKLKQAIYSLGGDALDAKGMPTAEAKYIGTITNAIKDTISKQAPEYGAVMKKYGEDTDFMKELRREFSTGDESRKLQAIRKLQQVWRQTAGVAHGAKRQLLQDAMDKAGNPSLMRKLAAEQYSSTFPRGMTGRLIGAGAIGAAAVEPEILLRSLANPIEGLALLGTAAATSPRIWGMGAYGAGKLGKVARPLPRTMPYAARLGVGNDNSEEPRARGGYFAAKRRGR